MKISPNFDLREFIHPDPWKQYGENSMWFVDPRLFSIAQCLRDRFGSTVINNWHYGGERVNSGFNLNREIGADYSQHKLGRALDCVFSDAEPNDVRQDIMENQRFWLHMGLTTLEHEQFASSWVHLDTRYTGMATEIFIVKP